MIYKQIEIDDSFQEFLMKNIYEARQFARTHPERICFITVSFPETDDSSCPDISVFLNYQPNYDISEELKNDIIEENKILYDSSPYFEDREPSEWYMSCYGSHSIGLSLEQFRKLESAYKAINI
jgi:hypothetical protein